jgi:NAD(P)-dependent dehydrogenase (short-subunit alcohol dehydrogenase family)
MKDDRKKALVIGGGSDIGAAIVKEFARSSEQYEIVWTYFNTNRVELPGTSMSCDITKTDEVQHVFDRVGELDILVTAAFPFLLTQSSSFNDYLKIESFLRGHIYAMTQALRNMRSNGRIINMLGQCVERGLPNAAFFSAAFAFLHNFGNTINAVEGKAGRVSVCDFLLGPVDTREWDGLDETVVQRYKDKVQQFINPKQVASMVRYFSEQEVMPSTFKLDAYYGY